MAKILASRVGDGSLAVLTACEEISQVVADDGEMVHKVTSVEKNVGKRHTADSCRR